MPRCYVAGPIESAPADDMNESLFDFVAERLRKQGCEVFNPWDLTRQLVGTLAQLQAMNEKDRAANRRGLLIKELKWICDSADFVVMLPNWKISPGATAEYATAKALSIPVFELPDEVATMQKNSWIDIDFDSEDAT